MAKYIWLPLKNQKDRGIMTHRDGFKTTGLIIVGAVWDLTLINPEETILLLSATLELSMNTLGSIKECLKKPIVREIMKAKYGMEEYIDPDRWTKKAVSLLNKKITTNEPNLTCGSMLQSKTGFHFSRIICDDTVDVKDKTSKTIREQKKIVYDDLGSIVKRGEFKSLIGTKWHKDSLYETRCNFKFVEFPIGTIPIKTITPEWIAEKKSEISLLAWLSQYRLIYGSNENLLFVDPIEGEPPEPDSLRRTMIVDPAFGGNDYTSVTVGGEWVELRYITNGWIWKEPLEVTYDKLEACFRASRAREMKIEENGTGVAVVVEMKRRGIPCTGFTATKNKHLRIVEFGQKWFKRTRFSYDVNSDYLEQILDYQEPTDYSQVARMKDIDAPDNFSAFHEHISDKGWSIH